MERGVRGPARSMRLRREKRMLVTPAVLRSVDSMVQVSTLWERLDSWFILVCPILRFWVPLRIRAAASSTAPRAETVRPERS